jgi:hypothetical protein
VVDAERSAPEGTISTADLPTTLDVNSLTLAEMAELEYQTGRSFTSLLESAIRGGATLRLLALWVQESRTSDAPRSWRQLGALRPYVSSSSTSPSSPDGRPNPSDG